jgi:NADH-quinone oxidoreductase subunit A
MNKIKKWWYKYRLFCFLELVYPYTTKKYGDLFYYINVIVVLCFWYLVHYAWMINFLCIYCYIHRNKIFVWNIKSTSLVGVIRYYMHTYMDMFIYSFLLLGICALLIGICYLLSMNNLYFEKLTGYECGFDPFSDARDPFNIKFYLISIIFIIFDVEAIFFLPWLICQNNLLYIGYYVMYLFYLILVLGFFYEWRKGTIDWD